MNLFSPAEVANNYLIVGKSKANMPISKLIVLGILAGFFIALGGVASSCAAASIDNPSLSKLLSAVVFPGGLTMVLLAGSELFTGNCLMIMPLLQKKITLREMLRNWILVYIGNFAGSIIIAYLVVLATIPSQGGNALAVSMICTASSKTSLSFCSAFIRGILCNFLVCTAVWIFFAAKDVVSKIAGLFFPIMFFVLSGFEHSVANMYYITVGLLCKNDPLYLSAALSSGVDISSLTNNGFLLGNLLPVSLGNIVGGAIIMAGMYWFIYLRDKKD